MSTDWSVDKIRRVPARVNADVKRRAVVGKAADLFDRAGYHTTSMSELAQAVGLRKPTLYHYFQSKDEILFSIHEEFIDLLLARQRARGSAPPAECLREVVGDVLSLMDTHPGHVRVFFEHYRELAEPDRATIRAKRDAYFEAVREVVVRGQAEGAFRELDPALVTLALFGMCNWAYQWYRPDGRLTSEAIAELFFDLFTHGLTRR